MAFRVSARTVLQLGAELISSDAIAFYELIKNAFDAKSLNVKIKIVSRMKYTIANTINDEIFVLLNRNKEVSDYEIQLIKEKIIANLDNSAPFIKSFSDRITKQFDLSKISNILDLVNYIAIEDTGDGMTYDDLENIYLTIGTRSRLKEREIQKNLFNNKTCVEEAIRPILGEKGVGRLSVMRLGERVRIKSKTLGEEQWNILEIDWSEFSHTSDKLIDEIEISPYTIEAPLDKDVKGTKIIISRLSAEWSQEKLNEIVRQEFTKLTDPFTPEVRYPISPSFNNKPVFIPPFNTILFDHAHAEIIAELYFDDKEQPHLVGTVNYKKHLRISSFKISEEHLNSISNVTGPSVLKSLGPFNVHFYWYNRQQLTGIDGIGVKKQVGELVNQWSGGLMVFRDGFRVNPYGSPDDDWLDLDRKALASGGYKVNRKQIIGKVDITSNNNPNLMDQTNREGLRDCKEKIALVNILNYVVKVEFKRFMEIVDKDTESKDAVDFKAIEMRTDSIEIEMKNNFKQLLHNYPDIIKESKVVNSIQSSIEGIRKVILDTKSIAKSFDKGRSELVHLAGLGLMVEILGHELNRATTHTLSILSQLDGVSSPQILESRLKTLEAQLKTLQKRIQILDPLGTAARQRKEKFDLIHWVKEIVNTHESQFKRHEIVCNVSVKGGESKSTWTVNMVKGMLIQILENLISNSVYWLKQYKMTHNLYDPVIDIILNPTTQEIRISDNGPGIDISRKEIIFKPFITTKPPNQGKGLGLFLSREIAEYHDAELYLADEKTAHLNKLNTFVLALEGKSL